METEQDTHEKRSGDGTKPRFFLMNAVLEKEAYYDDDSLEFASVSVHIEVLVVLLSETLEENLAYDDDNWSWYQPMR